MWWLVITTPDGIRCWPVWGEHDAPEPDLIDAARALVGFPAHEGWATEDQSTYLVQLTLGEPHASLLARAVVGDVSELRGVKPDLVEADRSSRRDAVKQDQVDAARAVLARLDPDAVTEVLAEHGVVRLPTREVKDANSPSTPG